MLFAGKKYENWTLYVNHHSTYLYMVSVYPDMLYACVRSFCIYCLVIVYRPILDRGFTPWDDYLTQIDSSVPPPSTGWVSNYNSYIQENKM